ncbi:GspH/FimT family pseudopilin [Acidovorax sp. Root219]|uniref:GspH/FimT family pseudopilin n=1 Tax=Acidovorax sp. Root219 TaxID=1736493 RepID=UPI003511156A
MKIMKASPSFHSPGLRALRGAARASAGFTAIELMVVVAIVGVLTALAAPSFTPLIERWRVREAAESITASVYLARSEAIKRGGNVVILKNNSNDINAPTCNNGTGATEWGCGWNVFLDVNANGSQDACVATATPNECSIQTVTAPTRVAVTLAGSVQGKIVIDRWGMASHAGSGSTAPTNMFFAIAPQGKTMTDPNAARLCVGMGGRIVRKKGSETC